MSDPIFTYTPTTSIGLYDLGEFASPSFVDIDNDGDLDTFIGDYAGKLLFVKNTGTATSPAFTDAVTNPFGLTNVGSSPTNNFAAPTFVDIDKDGDLDAFVGSWDGTLTFFENIGTAANPNFTKPTINPFGFSNSAGSYSAPTLVDIDNDGDLDAFVGSYNAGISFFRNTGTVSNPIFSSPVANRFGLTAFGYDAPTMADIDRDGDLDAFVGTNDGNTYFFRNSGTASNPIFDTATSNPFGLTNVGLFAKPNFVDIDKDGDLDAFIGNRDGNLIFFANSEIVSITGTEKADKLVGTDGKEIMYGLDKNDILDGGAGADTLIGGKGNDTYYIDNKDDVIKETSTLVTEIDKVHSSISYTLPANVENLTLTGKTVINGTGNELHNVLMGNKAANILTGGLGNDTYYIDNKGDLVKETSKLATEIDNVYSSISYVLTENVENLTLTGKDAIDATGNELNNILVGNVAVNILTGGLGNDTYYVDNKGDLVKESSKLVTEIDNVYSSINYTLTANVENMTLTGKAAIDGTGNELDNTLSGNIAANRLKGGAGNDILNGNAGDDSLDGGEGNNTLNGGAGSDTALFVGTQDNYKLSENVADGTMSVQDIHSNTVAVLHDIETISFADTTLDVSNGLPIDVKLAVSDYSINEGNSSNKSAVFTLTLATASDTPFSVDYNTVDGDAIAGQDYIASSGTVNFAAGETSKIVSVSILGDTQYESDEQFYLHLTPPKNVTTVDTESTATLLNDDKPSLVIAGTTVSEGNTGSHNANVTVTLSTALTQIVKVKYATLDETALAGSDYTAATGTLTFAAGVTSKTISVPVLGDTSVESDETFSLVLSAPTNATLNTTSSAVITITNDDADAVSVLFPEDKRSYDFELPLTEQADSVDGSPLNEKLLGLGGDDTLSSKEGNDYLDGGANNDTLLGDSGDDYMLGGDGLDSIWGGDGQDSINGGNGNNQLYGETGNDLLVSGAGNDLLNGGNGIDTITSGAGADKIQYAAITASGLGVGLRDVITDFDTGSGDVIDLYQVSDTPLNYLGMTAFDGTHDAVRFSIDVANKQTIIQLDLNGDKTADMEIELIGVKILSANDFLLAVPS
ncbi:MAG: hypothetical protein EPN17_11395 [Methylobacter sp.]|nr:MAG: hypothetical protein EPN17_11395 [Methylobacter sp.]